MSISGLVQPFTDPAGAEHPQCFWVPGTVAQDNLDQQGGIDWDGFHDSAHFLAHAAPVQGAQHHTNLPPALYAQVVAFPVAAGTYGTATETALDYLAVNVKDTAATNPDGTPQLDANNQPVMVSFFENAQVVTVG